jgi:ribosomal protein S18 acetylase RimI-like enzyme
MSGSTGVRRAVPADADLIGVLVRELAAHQDESEHVRIGADRWRELLGRDDVVVLIAERDGQVAGYVSALRRPHLWSGDDILALDDLYVRAQHRDGGVGRILMVELARLAQGLTIAWGIQPDNHDAQRFYRRLGANLRQKITASWSPTAYAELLAEPGMIGGRTAG